MCTPCRPKAYGNVCLYKAKIRKPLTIERPPTIELRYYALRQKRANIMRMIYEFAYENKALKSSADRWCREYWRKQTGPVRRRAQTADDRLYSKYIKIAKEGVTRIEIPDV